MPTQFFRIHLTTACFYVAMAEAPIDYVLGRTFTKFQLCATKAGARVYTEEQARGIRDVLLRLFASATLEQATFEEWVEQEAEPVSQ